MTGRSDTGSSADAGLGLVEVLVSMVILTITLLALVPLQTGALSGVTLAKERQQATGYANAALERVRATTLAPGGATAVAAGRLPDASDPGDRGNVTNPCAAGCRFQPTFGAAPRPSEILRASSAPDPSLLTQRCSEVSGCTATGSAVSGLTFTTRLYVSETDTATLYWVTAVTGWTSNNSKVGLRQVAVRTQIAVP